MKKPELKRYFKDGKDYTTIEAEVELEGFGVIASGNLVRLCKGYDKEVYFENDHAKIDLDGSKKVIYGYKKADGKNILDVLAFAMNGDTIRVVVEDFDKEAQTLASRLYSILISPNKFEIDAYRFEEGEK
ncbi:hypothetical protein GF361_02675 [Candidatus Woesearchaeota archaeon]|nr:hypothetical protein [Candidatus Woesearchaeota archaeon]